MTEWSLVHRPVDDYSTESLSTVATSGNFDFIEDSESTRYTNSGKQVVKMSNICSNEVALMEIHGIINSQTHTGIMHQIINGELVVSGRGDIIKDYKIEIYEWLRDICMVHVDVQEILCDTERVMLSPMLVSNINKSLKNHLIHVKKCDNHMPDIKHNCLMMMFRNPINKNDAFQHLSKSLKDNILLEFLPVNDKTAYYLETYQLPILEQITAKYKNVVDIIKENSGIWLQCFGDRDTFLKAKEDVQGWISSPKVSKVVFNKSKSQDMLRTYINGIQQEDKVLIYTSIEETEGVVVAPAMVDRTVLINGVKVSIVHGNIADQQADVIVNSTSKRLDVDVGEISGAILQGSGQELLEACSGNEIGVGQIFVTDGFDLPCKKIFHIDLKSVNFAKYLITTCLNEADDKHFDSIAIPPVGFGRLRPYRSNLIASFFEACADFSNKKEKTLKDVRFVIIDEDLVKYFVAYMKKLVTDGSGLWKNPHNYKVELIGIDDSIRVAKGKLTNFFDS